VEVVPREVLAVVADKQAREKLAGVKLEVNQTACSRAQVIGKKDGIKTEYIIDCMASTPLRLGGLIDVMTGVPPSITAQMQIKGVIEQPGVWAPEQVIEPEYFFSELAKREMHVQVTVKQQLA
jgi:saccharopine dehydrogenase-like NADP-dependent oxidoreductase